MAGAIAYYGLTDWWLSDLTEVERTHIQHLFPNVSEGQYTPGMKAFRGVSATDYLTGIAGNLLGPAHRDTARKVLTQAERMSETAHILDRHFMYSTMIRAYYRDRSKDPEHFSAAIRACEEQIQIAPDAAIAFRSHFPGDLPRHRGFEQLAIIREKQGHFQDAILLSSMALEQGWNGDWEKRIRRCEQKASQRRL